MWFSRDGRARNRGGRGIAVAMAVALAATVPTLAAGPRKAPEPAVPQAPVDTLVVGDTGANLQVVFANEINARERYAAMANVAEREGYPYVAQLFRACARAEQAHADQHMRAIAWTGEEAKALLRRVSLGTTAENLKAALDLETYEANTLCPAFLARARAEHMAAAVRSMNYALAAERDHVRLLAAALQTLDQRLAARTLWVCPGCGRTVESLDFKQCPNCFTSARKFVRVT
jgi:rubrerythrin